MRARRTAELILEKQPHKVPVIEDKRIQEINFGELEGVVCFTDEHVFLNEQMEKKKEEERIKKERAKVNSRYGSEDARFTDIHMYNEAGEESRIFKTGEKVILDLGYHVDNKVTDAVFGFGIFRNDALWCYGTNTRIDRIENFDIDKDGRYKVELEDLNLIPGNYWVDITIEYGEGIPVDYYKQALKFEVVSNITDVGVTRIPHKWELHI